MAAMTPGTRLRGMTLRTRLALAVSVLVLAGFVGFGLITYHRYSVSQYRQLDRELQAVFDDASRAVTTDRFDRGGGRQPAGEPGRSGSGFSLSGYYAELRSADGTVLEQTRTDDVPNLPREITPRTLFTVRGEEGGERWRVWSDRAAAPDSDGLVVVVAAPQDAVDQALRDLALLATVGGVILLTLIAGGTWLMLRHSLRPLERIAGTARAVSAGDLSTRASTDGATAEIGDLGTAFNTMLDDMESAFAERDATEHKLRQFLADAAHELRTPLTSIRGFAEMYRLGGAATGDERALLVKRIETESSRMGALVDDLLVLARLDQHRELEPTEVDLVVLAADACTTAVGLDAARQITLDAPESVPVVGDRLQLRRAITNLVANAVKHTPAGTPIEVTCRRVGGWATVVVRDHGGGLSADALEHVFDRFWQADPARVGAGTGLGLAIVAGIADAHSGTIEAANAPDGGLLAHIRLRRAP